MARLHQQQTDPEVLAQVAEVDAWACTGPRKNYIKSEEKSKQERQETREKVLNWWEEGNSNEKNISAAW